MCKQRRTLRPALGAGLCLLALSAPLLGPASGAGPADRWSDSRLTRVVSEFGSGHGKASGFDGGSRLALVARLARLQRQAAPTSVLYRYLTFTLAYFGADYQRNVRRLVYPVVLWERSDPRYERYQHHGFPGPPDPLDDVPDLLQRLYEHNRDSALLRILFSMALDGGPSEGLSYERVRLVTRYPSACLQTLQSSPDMTANAEEDFGLASPEEYAHAVAAIRQAARRGGPGQQRYAARFLRSIAADRRRTAGRSRPPSDPEPAGSRRRAHAGP